MEGDVQAGEGHQTAASAHTLDGSAIAVPRDEQAAFHELVIEIKVR